MKNITEILTITESVLNELRSEKTAEEVQQIFQEGAELRDKVGEMFKVGKEAAEDISQIVVLVANIVDRMEDAALTRSVPKPVKGISTLDDATVYAIHRLKKPQPRR